MKLIELIAVNPRFARSANIERDRGADALEGYVPTGRAIDVVRRVGLGLQDPAAGRTFSVTGPHGGGKSSMALFLASLLATRSSEQHKRALALLSEVDGEAAELLLRGLKAVAPRGQGFTQALVTATREPVASTLGRAVEKLTGKRSRSRVELNPIDAIRQIAVEKPTLIIIDEFGKNLEAFAQGSAEGDPYLLQELAELTQGTGALPLVVITMQHLAFDEYVTTSGSTQRREWAKVQGRFQDIPFIESIEQSRRLISSCVTLKSRKLEQSIEQWTESNAKRADSLGIRVELDATRESYPLHPIVLAVLPQLCARFGQNERTLFSFMAGPEPLAVPSFLAQTEMRPANELSFVGLDRVYDYFLESAGSSIGASSSVSRWIEIENRLRDTWGLEPLEEAVLKSMGVLNLMSSSGTLRASRPLLEFALNPHDDSTRRNQIRKALLNLEKRGVITYREFSDEYRIWQGSDFDLHGAIDVAKSEAKNLALSELLAQTVELPPAVAGRHSQQGGILRVFDRIFVDKESFQVAVQSSADFDGRVLLATHPISTKEFSGELLDLPVLLVSPSNVDGLRELALEAFALQVVINRAQAAEVDWVARRELSERLAAARLELNTRVFEAWLPDNSQWQYLSKSRSRQSIEARILRKGGTVSSYLSDVADEVYSHAPRIANEMLARRELTSQGAKARRLLLEALISNPSSPKLGLSGYGPERAMYEAVLRSPGIHREKGGHWGLFQPADPAWQPVWDALQEAVHGTASARASLETVMTVLERPPFGLKSGILPVFAIAFLLRESDDVALYEHGSLVLNLDDAVAERLAKNPGNFAVKYVGTTKGLRRQVIEEIADELSLSIPASEVTFLQVVKAVFQWMRRLPPYAQNVDGDLGEDALRVREAFKTAIEPDRLFFEELPTALGLRPFGARERGNRERAGAFARSLSQALRELSDRYPRLLLELQSEVSQQTGTPAGTTAELRAKLAGQAINLEGRILEPRLNAFVAALIREHLQDEAWVENVAMVVAEGVPPRSWADEDRTRFLRNLDELGGQLRRTQALLYENLSWDGEGFETRRITITAPDGDEMSDVVALRLSEVEELRKTMAPVISGIASRYGSRQNALRTLMALLAVEADSESKVLKERVSEKGA